MEQDQSKIETEIEKVVAQIPNFTENSEAVVPPPISRLKWSIHIPNALLKIMNSRLVWFYYSYENIWLCSTMLVFGWFYYEQHRMR